VLALRLGAQQPIHLSGESQGVTGREVLGSVKRPVFGEVAHTIGKPQPAASSGAVGQFSCRDGKRKTSAAL